MGGVEELYHLFGDGPIDFDQLGPQWWWNSDSDGGEAAAPVRSCGERLPAQHDPRLRITGSFLFAEELGELSCVSTGCWRAAGRLAGLDGGFVLADGGIFIASDWEDRTFAADAGNGLDVAADATARGSVVEVWELIE